MDSMDPSFERLPSVFNTMYLVSLRKCNYYAGKQIYGELVRSTAIGLLHARLYKEHFQYLFAKTP